MQLQQFLYVCCDKVSLENENQCKLLHQLHTLKHSDAEGLVEFLRRAVPQNVRNTSFTSIHKICINGMLMTVALLMLKQSCCDVFPVRTALDHLHVSTLLWSVHQTKAAMQSLAFFIVCHPLSVNVHALTLNALSVIHNSTVEWYLTYSLIWMKFPEYFLWNTGIMAGIWFKKIRIFVGIIRVLVVMESGLETLAGCPSKSVSSDWERPRGAAEWGVISDSEGPSATVDALSCKPKSAAFLTCWEDVAFLAKNVSILCVVFLILDIVFFSLFFFEHYFYACSQTSLNTVYLPCKV